jgi:membrane-bound lytic murein transglycosylase A
VALRLVAIIFSFVLASCGGEKDSPAPRDQIDLCGKNKDELVDEKGPRPMSFMSELTATYDTPTRELNEQEIPFLDDDLEFEGMEIAIERQLSHWRARPPSGRIKLGEKYYSLRKATQSLEKMRSMIGTYHHCLKSDSARVTCLKKFNDEIRRRFVVVQPELTPDDPRYGEEKQTLFTGYYTPVLNGTAEPTSETPHPIYLKPSASEYVGSPRVDIDFRGRLENQGLEIIYINELFASYLLHVQGSGKAVVRSGDGSREFYMGYAGTNGKPWNFISKYMMQKQFITNASIASQRKFLRENPETQEEVYASCPSYVYFLKTNTPPKGSGNVSVTPNRSIATDTKYYKFKGLLSYVSASRPIDKTKKSAQCKDIEFETFTRFFLDQDTGGAIRGKARVDLYFGEDAYAEVAAYNTVQRGDLYFLMLR